MLKATVASIINKNNAKNMEDQLPQVPAPAKNQDLGFDKIKSQIENILKDIQQARAKGNRKVEDALYTEAQKFFKQMTGEDLIKKAKEESMKEFESEGFGTSPKGDVFSEDNFNKQLEIFRSQQQSFGLKKAWDMISPEEKRSYQDDISVFVSDIEKKRTDLSRGGLNVSKEVFYNMVAGGYMFAGIKKSLFSGKIKIPVLLGEGAYKYAALSQKEFDNLINTLQILFDLIARQAVEDKLNKKFLNGKRRWNQRLKRNMRELLLNEINKIEDKKRNEEMIGLKIENEVQRRMALRAKDFAEELEGIKDENAFKNLEQLEHSNKQADKYIKKELEKITKNLSKEIKDIGQEETNIKKIIKKQEEKNTSLPKKAAYKKFIQENNNPPQL